MSPDKECPSLEAVNERLKIVEDRQFKFNGDVSELNAHMKGLRDSLDITNRNFKEFNEGQNKMNQTLLSAIQSLDKKEEVKDVWSKFVVSLFRDGIRWLIAAIFIALVVLILLNAKSFIPML